MPTLRFAAGTSSIGTPSTDTEPRVWRMKPAMIRSRVVLPQPEGPSSAISEPGATSSDTSLRAGTPP